MKQKQQVGKRMARKGAFAKALTAAGICLFATCHGQSRAHDRPARRPALSHNAASLGGTYTRIKRRRNENQSAILEVTQLRADRIKFHLTALMWSAGHSDTPHNGEIQATAAVRHHVAVYQNEAYRLTLRFGERSVVLTESGSNPEFGAYVTAAGTYRRTKRGGK